MEIRKTLVSKDPANCVWQRELSLLYNWIGTFQQAKGELASALKSYQAAMEIIKTLLAKDPANIEWQNDLSVSLNLIGGIQQAK
jgi:tetratricopeptide (TPR) repeat protein